MQGKLQFGSPPATGHGPAGNTRATPPGLLVLAPESFSYAAAARGRGRQGQGHGHYHCTGSNHHQNHNHLDLDIVRAEQVHLMSFMHQTHNLFQHIMYQKEMFCYHLQNFGFRAQQFQRFIFGPRLDELKKRHNCFMDIEVKIICEYFDILGGHHETLKNLAYPEEKKRAKNNRHLQMPDMLLVRQIAFGLLDRLVEFQLKVFSALIRPLEAMERELALFFANGMICWEPSQTPPFYEQAQSEQDFSPHSPILGLPWYENGVDVVTPGSFGTTDGSDNSTSQENDDSI